MEPCGYQCWDSDQFVYKVVSVELLTQSEYQVFSKSWV